MADYTRTVSAVSRANRLLAIASMARLNLESVTVDFPIYSGRMRSLRNELVSRGLGGSFGTYAGNRRPFVRALEGVSLDLADGDRLGIVGHNGAGKTTLLRVLSGIYEPTIGYVYRKGRTASLLNVSPRNRRRVDGIREYRNARLVPWFDARAGSRSNR